MKASSGSVGARILVLIFIVLGVCVTWAYASDEKEGMFSESVSYSNGSSYGSYTNGSNNSSNSTNLTQKQVNQVLEDYSAMSAAYENMGVSREELAVQINKADSGSKEMYLVLNDFCSLYERMKQAYKNCMTKEQYQVAEETLLAFTDAMIAQQAVATEQFLGFVEENSGDKDVEQMLDAQIDMLKITNETVQSSIALLENSLSKDIMKKFSTEEVRQYMEAGINLPSMIQLYIYTYNDGTYNELVDITNNLAVYSEQLMTQAQEYADFVLENERIQTLQAQYEAAHSAEMAAYYAELERSFSEMMTNEMNSQMLNQMNQQMNNQMMNDPYMNGSMMNDPNFGGF